MKRKTRLMISLIVAFALLMVAVPLLPMYETGLPFGFSLIWIGFCLLVIGANLHALMRLGRGERIDRPAFNKEQREALRKIRRYRARRMRSY